MSMGEIFLNHRHWKAIENKLCRLVNFQPLSIVENGEVISTDRSAPYAIIEIESVEKDFQLPPQTSGAVTHKLDFERLWFVINRRGLAEDEQVYISWTGDDLGWLGTLFPSLVPHLNVMIFSDEAFRLLTDRSYRPEFDGYERFQAELPTVMFQPSSRSKHKSGGQSLIF